MLQLANTPASKSLKLSVLAAAICISNSALAEHNNNQLDKKNVEEVKVWGESKASDQADFTTPNSVLTREDFQSINIATTEDVVKFEPSIVIRRRFIGDSNGTMGIRGSNMFQTSRSMVFADGVPLHYHLQSRWSGAPRWTMVSASEIAQVEVLYGPYSAEYSGNAMGGVVVIETAIPQQREFHFDGAFFTQDFNAYKFDDSVNGFKGFVSAADKIGDLSLYASYNHLNNDAQPQSFYYNTPTETDNPNTATGAYAGKSSTGDDVLYFSDSGVVNTQTDNLKFKVGYDFGHWQTLLNIAYEDRQSSSDSPNPFLEDLNGNKIWGGNVVVNGQNLTIPASRLAVSDMDRRSLSVGLRLKGDLDSSTSLEANLNQFSILEDQNRSSSVNPNHPSYTLDGQVSGYDDTGWTTAEAKLRFNQLGNTHLALVTGVRHESYQLNYSVYDSSNYAAGSKDTLTNTSGGETSINAAFAQFSWDINSQWDMAFGARFESWKSSNGYISEENTTTGNVEKAPVPEISAEKLSPKLSVGFSPNSDWQLRYSLARAYRFPIVEELFSQYQAYNAISLANPELKPEDGIHQNIMIERSLNNGYARINVFTETIEDAIDSQTTLLPGGGSVRTFSPVDETKAQGVEFIVNQYDFLVSDLDIRFNWAYIDTEVVSNSTAEGDDISPEDSIVGNELPRMPHWRGNLMANYALTEKWTTSVNLQYASDAYGRTDNTDTERNVYGAQDGYTRIGLKTHYAVNKMLKLGIGIDNLTNEIAYVAHPWPGRTVYFTLAYDLK